MEPAWLLASGAPIRNRPHADGLVLAPHADLALQPATPSHATMRAYFLGHVGKYVPGKAMTVILACRGRSQMGAFDADRTHEHGLETLTMMSVGAFLAAVMSAFVLHLEPVHFAYCAREWRAAPVCPHCRQSRGCSPALASCGHSGSTGTRSPNRTAPNVDGRDFENLQGINYGLLATGWFAATICWFPWAESVGNAPRHRC